MIASSLERICVYLEVASVICDNQFYKYIQLSVAKIDAFSWKKMYELFYQCLIKNKNPS
jgi:hypothetical protein